MKKLVILFSVFLLTVSAVSAATADSVQKSITIDGDSDDWRGVPSYSISDVNTNFDIPSSSSDYSGSFRSAWDSNYAYFLLEITDDDFDVDGGSGLSQHDSIELMIDGGNEKSSSYDSNDFKILIRADGGQVKVWDGSLSDAPTGVSVSTSRTSAGYMTEVGVSWSFIGQLPGNGATYGFDAAVNDRDNEQFEHFTMWQLAPDHVSSASGWGSIQLSGSSTSSQYLFSPSNLDFSFSSVNTLDIDISDTVVYDTGYYSTDGGTDWTQMSFSGSKAGDWVLSSASSSLSLSLNEVNSSGDERVAFYACSWSNGWDCHGNDWQIKQFEVTLPDAGSGSVCGNDVIETDEDCDGASLGGETCQTRGFDSGTLSCLSCSFDTSGCSTDSSKTSNGTHFLVQGGSPVADIVVAPDAPNMVQLAAEYFQGYIQDMTDATLLINNAPDSAYDFHVYIGESQYTDALGIDATGTRDDGYKIMSGEDFLVLLGDDERYNASLEMSDSEWDAYTAPDVWVNSFPGWKEYNQEYGIYEQDGRGSMNAVHDFLRDQGMRWYYPNDFGTVIPSKQDISFSEYSKTVNPDFPMRALYLYYKEFNDLQDWIYPENEPYGSQQDHLRWIMSLGQNYQHSYVQGTLAHGLNDVTSRRETKQDHPEYYAVWDGVRMDGLDGRDMKQNLCSQGLLEETTRYVKTMIEAYDAEYVSIWPADGFNKVSEHSQECLDMATPERGYNGELSNYVWDFVNNVAWAVYDEYGPEHKVLSGAYHAYSLPPTELSDPRGMAPNVAVMISSTRSQLHDTQYEQNHQELVNAWNSLVPGQVFTNDHYLENRKGTTTQAVPTFYPYLVAEDLRFIKDKSLGEFIEINTNWPLWNLDWDTFAAQSLNTYVTARLYWDVNKNVDEMLNEYYNLYYGPASQQMRQLYEYSEANLDTIARNPEHIESMRTMAKEALATVSSGSVYEKRIQNLLDLINSNYEGEQVEISSCQDLTSPGTTYKLTQDVSASGSCFLFDQNGITLDCQGNTIIYGTGGGNNERAIHTSSGGTNRGHYATIRNCRIRDGGSATGEAVLIGKSYSALLENNDINVTGRAIWTSFSVGDVFKNNTVHSQQGDAIFAQYGGVSGTNLVSSNIWRGNMFSSGAGKAAYLYQINNDTIVNNTFRSSGDIALHLYKAKNTIIDNNIIQSESTGALRNYQPENLQFIENTIIDG